MSQKKKWFQSSASKILKKGTLALLMMLVALATMGTVMAVSAQDMAKPSDTDLQASLDDYKAEVGMALGDMTKRVSATEDILKGISIYGVIDSNVASSTNMGYPYANGKGGVSVGGGDITNSGTGQIRTDIGQGVFQGSRWGIRAVENVGNGTKAIATLEGGLYPGTGAIDQQGQLFGRQAWVGLDNTVLGQLTMGRTYGTLADAIGLGDVFGVNHGNLVLFKPTGSGNTAGNYGGTNGEENTFFLNYSGLRWDESVKYISSNWFGFIVGADYAFGNPAGDLNGNCMYAASLTYNCDPMQTKLVAAFQNENDGAMHNHYDEAGAMVCNLLDQKGQLLGSQPAMIQLYGFYMQSNFDRGFMNITGDQMVPGSSYAAVTSSASTNTGDTIANANSETSAPAQDRFDQVINASIKYIPVTEWEFICSYYNDFAGNVINEGDSGVRDTYLFTADYYLSKKSDIYICYGYSNLSGALDGGSVAGSTGTTSAGVSKVSAGSSTAAGMFATSGISQTSLYTIGTRYRF